ncbi:MAG: hypothetical protein R2733_26545 [Acidimicrobiales bacterium]
MTSTITPLAQPSTSTGAQEAAATPVTAGPARGIAMGAALSAPMWLGILYLLRQIAQAL